MVLLVFDGTVGSESGRTKFGIVEIVLEDLAESGKSVAELV
jgi:hypothetical protein